jgi:hypothetical protein
VEPGPTTVKETRDNISRAMLGTMGASRFIVGTGGQDIWEFGLVSVDFSISFLIIESDLPNV